MRLAASPLKLLLTVATAAAVFAACSPAPPVRPAAATAPLPTGPRLSFDLESIDGARVSSESLRGRNTVVAFITTYDLPSQAQANFLRTIAHEHVPRTNVIAIVLERAESRPLVRAFADTLALRFPIAMLESNRLEAVGFRDVSAVPTVIVLDRETRLAWKKTGIIEAKEIAGVLRGLE